LLSRLLPLGLLVSQASATQRSASIADDEVEVTATFSPAGFIDLVFVLEVLTERATVPVLSLDVTGSVTGCASDLPSPGWRVRGFDDRPATPFVQSGFLPRYPWISEPESGDRSWTVPVRLEVEGGGAGCTFQGTVEATATRAGAFGEPLEEDLGVSVRWVSAGGTAP
jgi:hypothetical protein